MYRIVPISSLAITILLLLSVPARGQDGQQGFRFVLADPYVNFRLAVNNYGGERGGSYDNRYDEFARDIGGGFGIEFGTRISGRHSLGLFYQGGRFSRILVGGDGRLIPSLRRQHSSDWIHMGGLAGRYYFRPAARYAPYVQLGLTGAAALLNKQISLGVGPRLGAGIEAVLSPRLATFVEAEGIFIAPGNAMDLAGPVRSTDFFSFLGVGVRYLLPSRSRSDPVYLRSLYGPERVRTGEEAVFAADINHTAAIKVRWDFGDGATAFRPVAAHRFTVPGTYVVAFTVTRAGVATRRTLSVEVEEAIQPPVISMQRIFPSVPREGQPVEFRSTIRGSEPLTCRWDFGDGTVASSCTATHIYEREGTFTVTVEVENGQGTASMHQNVVVQGDPCTHVKAMERAFFDANESHLSTEARTALRENVGRILRCPGLSVEILGYAAPGELNASALSSARAQAVLRYYQTLGVPARAAVDRGNGEITGVPKGDALWQYRYVETIPHRSERR